MGRSSGIRAEVLKLEGAAIAQAVAPGANVVVIDVNMPDMNGIDATRELSDVRRTAHRLNPPGTRAPHV